DLPGAACGNGVACTPDRTCHEVAPSQCVAESCAANADCDRDGATGPDGTAFGTNFCLLPAQEWRYEQSPRKRGLCEVRDCAEPEPCLGTDLNGPDVALGIIDGCTLMQACACGARSELCECSNEGVTEEPGDRSETWRNPREYRRCFSRTARSFNAKNDDQ